MPTIFRKDGFRYFFYSNEGNEPPHVHVCGKGGEMKIWLDPLKVASVFSMSAREQRQVLALTLEQRLFFLEKWNEFSSRKA